MSLGLLIMWRRATEFGWFSLHKYHGKRDTVLLRVTWLRLIVLNRVRNFLLSTEQFFWLYCMWIVIFLCDFSLILYHLSFALVLACEEEFASWTLNAWFALGGKKKGCTLYSVLLNINSVLRWVYYDCVCQFHMLPLMLFILCTIQWKSHRRTFYFQWICTAWCCSSGNKRQKATKEIEIFM